MKQFLQILRRCGVSGLALMAAAAVAAETAPPRDSNFGNTAAYEATRVETKFMVPVRESTKILHFIRDNNDPRVVTKTYLLKNVDAYEFRDYLRQMVQAKRVGNTTLQQVYPGNANPVSGSADAAGTAASAALVTPVTAQPGYDPSLQLGSNTAVECLKYVDGTGLLIVSAEEYRFQDHENGMGIDSLVEFLDKPQMGADFGTQTFVYVPKFVPARNLMPMIENVGMNTVDVSEVWQGMDLVACDSDLNWLIFDVVNFSQSNIETMLAQYDVPVPQVKIRITVYELYHENDEKLGIDFQAWKNNDGMDFFSAGGRYRDNWAAAYNGTFARAQGSERTSFYNFNPKWNSRYLDFVTAKGAAKIAATGELSIRNNTPATLARTTQIFYMDKTKQWDGATDSPDLGVRFYRLLSLIAEKFDPGSSDQDYPVAKAPLEEVAASATFGFTLTVNNASVNLQETRLNLTLSNSSLIGFSSDGTPRFSANSVVEQDVSLPHGTHQFIIGGLKKQTEVTSVSGIPWLKDIPYLRYLFSTESKSIKTSELVVVGECSWDAPDDKPAQPARSKPHVR